MAENQEVVITLQKILDRLGGLPSRFQKQENVEIGVGETKTVFTRTGHGILREIIIRSPSTDFRVAVLIDGEETLNASYSELSVIGQNSNSITAVEELDYDGNPTGYYVVSIRLLVCSEGIEVRVTNTGASSIILSHVFVDYAIL